MTTPTWTVETKTNGTVTADAITSDWPTLTRGEQQTVRFWFDNPDGNGELVVEDGETTTVPAGSTETVRHVRVEDGGTFTVDGTLNVTEGGLFTLRKYLDWADAAGYGQGVNNVPWFRNQLPTGAGVESLVLGMKPNSDLRDRSVNGLWGLVTGGRDARNNTLTNWQLELTCFVLADWDAYDSHAAVESDLEA